MEEDLVNLRKEFEKNKDELNMWIKYVDSTEALDQMLSKKNHNKDINGVGFDKGKSSYSKDSLGNEIHFTTSSEGEDKKTFIVYKPIEKKTYVSVTKNQSKNQHVDPKRKGKVDDGGFTRVEDTRKSSRRPSYASPRKLMRNDLNNNWYVH